MSRCRQVKVLVDVSPEFADRIRGAMDAGSYETLQEFVRTAVANQVELEAAGTSSVSGSTTFESIELSDSPSSLEGSRDRTVESPLASIRIRDYGSLSCVDPPVRTRLRDGPLWGQYNRLLPVKLVVRSLANVLADASNDVASGAPSPSRIPLDPFSEKTAQVARVVGQQLAERDEAAGRKRGEKLSTAFPKGDDPRKSKDRFQSHFVGHSDRHDNLKGAPAHLLFVDITSDDPSEIGLTEHGLAFARLPNPVLDEEADDGTALSDKERQFYLDHVEGHLPREHEAMTEILRAIAEGDDRPDELTERIEAVTPDGTRSKANTVRSGLLGRMSELGLVERRRVGQRGIAYDATDEGQQLIDTRLET